MSSGDRSVSVLVVDDSRLARRQMRDLLALRRNFSVIAEAATLEEAVSIACALKPRLITMDIELPGGSGLIAIERIMALEPTRILVVTGTAARSIVDLSFEALSRGALDVVTKSTVLSSDTAAREEFLQLVQRLASVPVMRHVAGLARTRRENSRRKVASRGHAQPCRVIAIGASTGGPRVIASILERLPKELPVPVVIVQHFEADFATHFSSWLRDRSTLPVHDAVPGQRIQPGHVYIASGGPHIRVTRELVFRACHELPRGGHQPSVDVLFESIAHEFGVLGAAVLLTGMGRDGAEGLRAVHEARGLTIAQDEASCAVFGMPLAAIELGAAQHVLSPSEIIKALLLAAVAAPGST